MRRPAHRACKDVPTIVLAVWLRRVWRRSVHSVREFAFEDAFGTGSWLADVLAISQHLNL